MSRQPVPSDPPVETAAIRRLYRRPPSFTDLLPWVEYLPDSRSFLLEDGVSVGALFELTPVGTEARTTRFMTALRDAIQTALTDAIPERDDAPWILQVYVQDTPSLKAFRREVADYARPEAADSAFTRHFRQTLAEHLARIASKISELQALKSTLETLVTRCHGDDRPDEPDDGQGCRGPGLLPVPASCVVVRGRRCTRGVRRNGRGLPPAPA